MPHCNSRPSKLTMRCAPALRSDGALMKRPVQQQVTLVSHQTSHSLSSRSSSAWSSKQEHATWFDNRQHFRD